METSKVQIIKSYLDPTNKEVIWMRPFLDKEGYEFLYYGANGWTPFCNDCHRCHHHGKDEFVLEDSCKCSNN